MDGRRPAQRFPGRALPACLAALVAWTAGAMANAEHVIVETGGFSWTVAGYATLLHGIDWLDTAEAPAALGLARRAFVHGGVARVAWRFGFGDAVTVAIDDRFDAWASDVVLPLGMAAGVGVSAVPPRTLDLRSVLYRSDRAELSHDVDRAVVRVESGAFELAIGRQAIAWGVSALFPVADWWAPLSPYELDPTTKRGVDAARVRWSRGRADVEALVADRGRWRDLGAGVLVRWSLDWGDLYTAVARSWDEAVAALGGSVPVGKFVVRGEALGVVETTPRWALRQPRVTAGVDWLPSPQWTMTLEAHYNGEGSASAQGYVERLTTSAVYRRGEVYLLGRWYAGLVGAWQTLDARLRLRGGALLNAVDPSALVSWSMAWEVSEGADLEVGGLHGLGRALAWPAGAVVPEVRSEFGPVGHLVYLRATMWL